MPPGRVASDVNFIVTDDVSYRTNCSFACPCASCFAKYILGEREINDSFLFISSGRYDGLIGCFQCPWGNFFMCVHFVHYLKTLI